MKWIAVVAIVVGIALGSATVALVRARPCESRRPERPAAPAGTTKEQAAEAYRTAVAPVNAAQAVFAAAAQGWNGSTSRAQARSEAAPLLAVFDDVRERLRTIADGYPPATQDIDAGIAAVVAVQNDLLALAQLNTGMSVSSWANRYTQDIGRLIAASDVMRTDLGLPPVAR